MQRAERILRGRQVESVPAVSPNFVVPGPNSRATAQQPSYVPRSYRSTRPFRIQRQHSPRPSMRSDRREDSIITNSQLDCCKNYRRISATIANAGRSNPAEMVVIRKRFCGRSRVTSRKNFPATFSLLNHQHSSLANVTIAWNISTTCG